MIIPVKGNGQVGSALLDSGSSMSLIKNSHVPTEGIAYGHQTVLQCVHCQCRHEKHAASPAKICRLLAED